MLTNYDDFEIERIIKNIFIINLLCDIRLSFDRVGVGGSNPILLLLTFSFYIIEPYLCLDNSGQLEETR